MQTQNHLKSQIWNFKRINTLQNDVDTLKNFVGEMRKHFDFFELNEFENDVSIFNFILFWLYFR